MKTFSVCKIIGLLLAVAISARAETHVAVPVTTIDAIKVENYGNRAPENDALLSLSPAPFPKGRIVYTNSLRLPLVPGFYGQCDNNITFREFGDTGSSPRVTNYELTRTTEAYGGGGIFTPLWSPSGKRVLFRHGSQSVEDAPQGSYVLDLTTHRLSGPVTTEWINDIKWSPDGNTLAFMQGVRHMDSEWADDTPMPLFLYDVRTGKQRVFRQESVGAEWFEWTKNNTLLYQNYISVLRAPANLRSKKKAGKKPFVPPGIWKSAGIWESDAQGRNKRLLIPNAIFPLPSPDNQWILCQVFDTNVPVSKMVKAPPDELNDEVFEEEVEAGRHLCLYSRTSKRCVVLPFNPRWQVQWSWSGNGKKLVGLKQMFKRSGPVLIEYDIATRQRRIVATLYEAGHFDRAYYHFVQVNLNSVSADGRFAFVIVSDFKSKDGKDQYYHQLKAFDLRDGSASNLIETTATGLDWLPMS